MHLSTCQEHCHSHFRSKSPKDSRLLHLVLLVVPPLFCPYGIFPSRSKFLPVSDAARYFCYYFDHGHALLIHLECFKGADLPIQAVLHRPSHGNEQRRSTRLFFTVSAAIKTNHLAISPQADCGAVRGRSLRWDTLLCGIWKSPCICCSGLFG
jgi:hypothetical protein